MNIEVSLQTLFFSSILVDESVGLLIIGEAARNHINVEVFGVALEISALQAQRRRLPFHVICGREGLFYVVVDILEGLPRGRIVVGEVANDVEVVILPDEGALRPGAPVSDEIG